MRFGSLFLRGWGQAHNRCTVMHVQYILTAPPSGFRLDHTEDLAAIDPISRLHVTLYTKLLVSRRVHFRICITCFSEPIRHRPSPPSDAHFGADCGVCNYRGKK